MRLGSVFAGLAITLTGISAAGGEHLTAAAISDSVGRIGAEATIAKLWGTTDWRRMENHIARGEVAWIALVPKLAAGADGAAAEDLGIDLAEALPNNPLAVLRVIDVQDRSPILGPSRVCGIPFIEPQPGVVDRNRRKALTAVSAVRGGRLFKVRQDCLSALRQGSDRRGDLAARSPRH